MSASASAFAVSVPALVSAAGSPSPPRRPRRTPIWSLATSSSFALAKPVPLLLRSRHLAVLAADGELVGVISAHDLVRWLGTRCR